MMPRVRRFVFASALFVAACAPATTSAPPAEGPLDRSVMPQPGPRPEVDFPEIQRFSLSNGLPVWLVERPGTSLVTVQLLLPAGGVVDPPELPGLASLTAAMLTEGTTSRTATQIANEIGFLAASLDAGNGRETAVVTLNTLTRTLEPALDVFADVIMNPAFRSEDWDRVQQQRLVSLLQALDQPGTIASQEFSRIVYGDEHPYGRPLQGSPASVRAITPDDLRAFHARNYTPAAANLIVVGDVEAGRARQLLESELGSWRGAPAAPRVAEEGPVARTGATIYLIDKPGAAQSEIRIGHEGIERGNRDYFPILVLNALLGGDFSSRINMNLREDKGYTYGASSSFQTGTFVGAFLTGAAVQTAFTDEAVTEFLRELREIREGRPPTAAEVEQAKSGMIRREPLTVETNGQIASRLSDVIHFRLPPDYLDEYTDRIAEVTVADVQRVARDHLRPDRTAIVVVGDRAVIEPDLRALGYPIEIVTLEPVQ